MKVFKRFTEAVLLCCLFVGADTGLAQGEGQIAQSAAGPTGAQVAQPMTPPEAAPMRMVVTIGGFKNKAGVDGQLFDSLLDRITNSIVNTRKFEVVDQARLGEVLSQHKLADMGMSDANDAPKKGKIKSAGFILYGTVMSLGASSSTVSGDGYSGKKVTAEVELNVRFTEVETGHAVASKSIKSNASKSNMAGEGMTVASNIDSTVIQDAIEDAARKVTEELMELAYPTRIIKVGQYDITVNLPKERAKVGQILKVFVAGEPMVDPDTGETLGNDEQYIGEAQVNQVFPKFAKAVPVGGLPLQGLRAGMTARPVSDEEMAQRIEAAKAQQVQSFKSRF